MILFLVAVSAAYGLAAQETTVTVKVQKEGVTVKDTTYTFDSTDEAEEAVQMMEILTGTESDMMEIHKKIVKEDGEKTSSYVFVTTDGEGQKMKVVQGDSAIWISEGSPHHKHVVVKKSVDGEEWEITAEEESDMEMEVEVQTDEDVEVIVIKKKTKK